jgi:UDP-glucuronate 4-epimerase
MRRDFTYIDDLVEGVVRLVDVPPPLPGPGRPPAIQGDSLSPVAPFRIVNVGTSQPVVLGDFVAAIEAALGRPVARRLLPMQPGDVPATWADTSLLAALTGHRQATPLAEGVRRFVDWYRAYQAA